jgi:hypothetical protein
MILFRFLNGLSFEDQHFCLFSMIPSITTRSEKVTPLVCFGFKHLQRLIQMLPTHLELLVRYFAAF